MLSRRAGDGGGMRRPFPLCIARGNRMVIAFRTTMMVAKIVGALHMRTHAGAVVIAIDKAPPTSMGWAM